jgi:hypothetical protein
MNKNLRMFRSKGRKPYWGVLAHEPAYKKFQEIDNFMSLLQELVPIAKLVPVSARYRVPEKDKPTNH